LHPVASFVTLVSPRGERGTRKQTSQAPQPHRADLVRDFVQVRQAKAQSTSSKRGETYKAGNAGTQTLANKAAPAKISAELVADQKTKAADEAYACNSQAKSAKVLPAHGTKRTTCQPAHQ